MYSACKLKTQGDNIQPWFTSFPIWNQSIVPSPVLTTASWPAYRFLRRQVRSSSIFQNLLWSTQSKASVVNEAEVNVFLELPCFFYDPTDVSNFISGSTFSKSSFYIWELSVPVLLKPSLKSFENYLASVWDEHNCAIVSTSFGIALWDLNENRPFSLLWPLLSFSNLLAYWV